MEGDEEATSLEFVRLALARRLRAGWVGAMLAERFKGMMCPENEGPLPSLLLSFPFSLSLPTPLELVLRDLEMRGEDEANS